MGQAQNQIFDGMELFDWEGSKIGKVVRYDLKLGYVESEGTFSGRRYIPLSAIESVGPAGAYLNVPASAVKDLYQHTPKVTPDVDASGRLTGGGKIPSGYSGRPVPLDADGIRFVREKITNGSKVFDADGKKVGAVQEYDKNTGYMRIEKGDVFTKDIFLPVTAVSYLDDKGIHLSEPKDSLMNHFMKMPDVAQEFFTH